MLQAAADHDCQRVDFTIDAGPIAEPTFKIELGLQRRNLGQAGQGTPTSEPRRPGRLDFQRQIGQRTARLQTQRLAGFGVQRKHRIGANIDPPRRVQTKRAVQGQFQRIGFQFQTIDLQRPLVAPRQCQPLQLNGLGIRPGLQHQVAHHEVLQFDRERRTVVAQHQRL